MGEVVDFAKHKNNLNQARKSSAASKQNDVQNTDNSPKNNRYSEYRDKFNKAKGIIEKNKELAKKVKSAATLPKQIEPTNDWPMIFPIFFGVVKDLLDWIGFSLPVLNESLNLSVMGLTSLTLILIGSTSKNRKKAKGSVRYALKWFAMLTGTTAEEFFGINLLPIETITIVVSYILVLYERAEDDRGEKESEKNGENDEEQESYAKAA